MDAKRRLSHTQNDLLKSLKAFLLGHHKLDGKIEGVRREI